MHTITETMTFNVQTKLRYLDVSNNQLKTLPAEIGQLRNLQVLNVAGNKLRTLPVECSSLIALERLHFSPNPRY